MIEIPRGWRDTLSFKFQKYLDKILLSGLIVGGTGRKEGRQTRYFSAAHPQESKAVPDRQSWQPRLVPHVHHKWHTDTVHEITLVNSQEMGLKCNQPFSYAVVYFGDIPAECIARVVGHDQTILYAIPSETTPHALSIHAEFRASGDRLLDQDQQQERLDLTESCVNSILQSHHKDELGEEVLQYQQQWTNAQQNYQQKRRER